MQSIDSARILSVLQDTNESVRYVAISCVQMTRAAADTIRPWWCRLLSYVTYDVLDSATQLYDILGEVRPREQSS